MTKAEIEAKIKEELSDWNDLWDGVGDGVFDIDKLINGQYIVFNEEAKELLGKVLNSDGTYSFTQVKAIKSILQPDEDTSADKEIDAINYENDEGQYQKSYYEGDVYDPNRNISWIDPDTKEVTTPKAFTSHFDKDYLTRVFANDNTQIIVEYQDKFVDAGLMTDDEQGQELGTWGPLTRKAFTELLLFIDNNMDYDVDSPKFTQIKTDIQEAFKSKTFIPDPLGVDFYSGMFKEADEEVSDDILNQMAIREILNIGINTAIKSQEIIEKQLEEEFEKTVKLVSIDRCFKRLGRI